MKRARSVLCQEFARCDFTYPARTKDNASQSEADTENNFRGVFEKNKIVVIRVFLDTLTLHFKWVTGTTVFGDGFDSPPSVKSLSVFATKCILTPNTSVL